MQKHLWFWGSIDRLENGFKYKNRYYEIITDVIDDMTADVLSWEAIPEDKCEEN